MAITVTVTATDSNGQQAQSTGGSVTPGSVGVPTSVNAGETSILANNDSGNANVLIAQPVTLSGTGPIVSLSVYVAVAGGQMRLGLYSDSLGPNSKLAETAAFTPVVGWNTQPTLTNPSLQPGTYWPCCLAQSGTLACRNGTGGAGLKFAQGVTFGVLPTKFPTSASAAYHFSMYGTFTQTSASTPSTWVNSDILPPPTGFAVVLSNSSLSNLGAQNKGAVVGAISVINGTQTTPVIISGPDAAKFAVTNGGMVPCNLIAAVDIPAGSYSIILSAT